MILYCVSSHSKRALLNASQLVASRLCMNTEQAASDYLFVCLFICFDSFTSQCMSGPCRDGFPGLNQY